MPYQTVSGGASTITSGVAAVDCHKQVRSWRLLRSLLEFLIPSCNCTFTEHETKQEKSYEIYHLSNKRTLFPAATTITGTIFGFRRGKASLCIQTNTKSTDPILLLEFAMPTTVLAREMQGGILRIALECSSGENSSNCLLSMPVWTVYCNGRKGGYAVKRRPSKVDVEALKIMNSVVVGAGIISGKQLDKDDELMYLRAKFARVSGSSEAESFHLIDPDGSIGQELSIFFFRSR